MTVAIGINGQVGIGEASQIIGCSQANIKLMIDKGKIKAQKKSRAGIPAGYVWMCEYDDVLRMKQTFKPRKYQRRDPGILAAERLAKAEKNKPKPVAITQTIQFDLDRKKFDLLTLVCEVNGTNLIKVLQEKIDELYHRSTGSLKFDASHLLDIPHQEIKVDVPL